MYFEVGGVTIFSYKNGFQGQLTHEKNVLHTSTEFLFISLHCFCHLSSLIISKNQIEIYQIEISDAFDIFSSPEPKAHGELIVYQSSRRPSVRA